MMARHKLSAWLPHHGRFRHHHHCCLVASVRGQPLGGRWYTVGQLCPSWDNCGLLTLPGDWMRGSQGWGESPVLWRGFGITVGSREAVNSRPVGLLQSLLWLDLFVQPQLQRCHRAGAEVANFTVCLPAPPWARVLPSWPSTEAKSS